MKIRICIFVALLALGAGGAFAQESPAKGVSPLINGEKAGLAPLPKGKFRDAAIEAYDACRRAEKRLHAEPAGFESAHLEADRLIDQLARRAKGHDEEAAAKALREYARLAGRAFMAWGDRRQLGLDYFKKQTAAMEKARSDVEAILSLPGKE